jgi:hypothetical protein
MRCLFAGILVLSAVAGSIADDKVETAAQRTRSVNNLKMIGLAMHMYHDKHGEFPTAAICDANGKPLLSWRVALLPFLDEEKLYNEFKLNEPWDSEHNKKLLERMPKLLGPVRGKTDNPYDTFYRVFQGGGAIFDLKTAVSLAKVTDGTSNTIMAVEAGEAVPWTKPDELVFDPSKPLPKLGGLFDVGFNALITDGSVRMISRKVSEKTLKALITRAGGEITDQ